MTPNITNVFVLMLENRSFDQLLGFSGITGTDAQTGEQTTINGVAPGDGNSYMGVFYPAGEPAPENLPADPGHEFTDVLVQLAGQGATYPPHGAYPAIDNSGFVASYAQQHGNVRADIMACCSSSGSANQIPNLYALATQYAVCDAWYASMPGSTWPNRFFAAAATSQGLDHDPNPLEIVEWDIEGFAFQQGTIYDALDAASQGFGWRIFGDGDFTISAALKGVGVDYVNSIDDFFDAMGGSSYPWPYTFIEPDYGDFANGTYLGGTSQHPIDSISNGDTFIGEVYNAIRNSAFWETSVLIVTWDEHGGFYDHAVPPSAAKPGGDEGGKLNESKFTFEQLGVRVPAVVVSPLVASNVIDHRTYDHTSILAMVEKLFGLAPLTHRDANANDPGALLTLSTPRADCPRLAPSRRIVSPALARPPDPASPPRGTLPGFVYVAMRHDLALSPPGSEAAIRARVAAALRTRADAEAYVQDVRTRLRARRARLRASRRAAA